MHDLKLQASTLACKFRSYDSCSRVRLSYGLMAFKHIVEWKRRKLKISDHIAKLWTSDICQQHRIPITSEQCKQDDVVMVNNDCEEDCLLKCENVNGVQVSATFRMILTSVDFVLMTTATQPAYRSNRWKSGGMYYRLKGSAESSESMPCAGDYNSQRQFLVLFIRFMRWARRNRKHPRHECKLHWQVFRRAISRVFESTRPSGVCPPAATNARPGPFAAEPPKRRCSWPVHPHLFTAVPHHPR